nr:phospholipase-like protein [Tanacetum cinerariifolium]
MPNNIKTYDGSDDPEDHLKFFQAAAKVKRWTMPTWCHIFNYTLTGSARRSTTSSRKKGNPQRISCEGDADLSCRILEKTLVGSGLLDVLRERLGFSILLRYPLLFGVLDSEYCDLLLATADDKTYHSILEGLRRTRAYLDFLRFVLSLFPPCFARRTWVPRVLVTCRSRQIDDENVPLNYYINNDLNIQFGREEFCLVTGLRFGVENREEYDTQANLPFRRRVFSSHLDGQPITGIDVAHAIVGPTFAELYDDDAVGLCCLGILQLVILGAESKRNVPEWLLRIANDRVAWNKYPWGSYVWPTLYSQLRNANVRRWGPLYVDQPRNEDDQTTYSIFGYTWAFKNIPNREKRQQLPSKYLVTPFTAQPPTTMVPKQRVSKNKNKGKKANLMLVNLGGVLEGHNEEDNNVTFLGSQFTGNILFYENVDPAKVQGGNYENVLHFLNNPYQIYLDCYMRGYVVPVSFWQELAPHLCMPDTQIFSYGTPIGWLGGEHMNSWMELMIRRRSLNDNWTVAYTSTISVHPENNQFIILSDPHIIGTLDGSTRPYPSWNDVPSYIGRPNLQTTIETQHDFDGLVDQGKKANLSPVNLGSVLEGLNEEDNNVTFLGFQFTGNILFYENVDPAKHMNSWMELMIRRRPLNANWTVAYTSTISVHPENNQFIILSDHVIGTLDGSTHPYPSWNDVDWVFLPIHVAGNHWATGVIHLANSHFYVFDSMSSREKNNVISRLIK